MRSRSTATAVSASSTEESRSAALTTFTITITSKPRGLRDVRQVTDLFCIALQKMRHLGVQYTVSEKEGEGE